MKFNLKKSVLQVLWLVSVLAMVGHTPALAQVPPSSQSSVGVGHADLVLARSLYAIDRSGGGLTLPDGSVIKTVWPAALEVTTITDNPKWANQPVRPRCEPAVYSLARVMPDGQELWVKSYINKGEVTDVCYAEYFGFDVRSALSEAVAPGYYRFPFAGRFFVGEPTDPRKFEVDVATGNVVGVVPKNLRVVDAAWLRQVKERIWSDLKKKYPDKKITDNFDWKRKPAFFKAVEKAVFATPPAIKN